MWVVVHMDMYSGDGEGCDSIFSGRLVEVHGPFDNEADAKSYQELKDGEDLYAQDFEVRRLKTPEA